MSRGYSFCLIQASITILTCLLNVGAFPENFVEVKPSPQQVAWQDLEFGVIIHFSTNTFWIASGETVLPIQRYLVPPISMQSSGCAPFRQRVQNM